MKYTIHALVMAAWLGLVHPAMAAPQKVVSLNLCTDQLAASMLTPATLKGLSYNAADPALSLVSGVAQDYMLLKGTTEEMAKIQPDLVLMGAGQNPQLQRWLTSKGIPFTTLKQASSIEEVQNQVAELAKVLGMDDYALNLRARQNIVIGQARLPQPNMRVAVYYPRGFTDGRGTLIHDLITRLGGRNIAAKQGQQGSAYLSLEQLVAQAPDVLIIPLYDYDIVSQAEKLSQHPALKGIKAHVVPLPGQYLTCPHLGLEAVANTISGMVRQSMRDAATREKARQDARLEGSKDKP
jgi:iron complex transport system substrate-binding protein